MGEAFELAASTAFRWKLQENHHSHPFPAIPSPFCLEGKESCPISHFSAEASALVTWLGA